MFCIIKLSIIRLCVGASMGQLVSHKKYKSKNMLYSDSFIVFLNVAFDDNGRLSALDAFPMSD